MRFIIICIAKKDPGKADGKRQEPLSAKELIRAETRKVVDCQATSFATEIAGLKAGRMKADGRLKQLSPYIDEDGVVRVGGRISKAPVDYATRCSVILPPSDEVTRPIVTLVSFTRVKREH